MNSGHSSTRKAARTKSLEIYEALLSALLRKQKVEKGRGDSRAKPGRAEPTFTVKDLCEEISKDVEQVLKDNKKTFEEKFEAQQRQLEEVKVTVRHESDRVIDAVLAGPHERIKDQVSSCSSFFQCYNIYGQDLYHIWKEMVRMHQASLDRVLTFVLGLERKR